MSADSDYTDRLELWATLASQELQEFCDDAQIAAGDPDGEGELEATRELIAELDQIMQPKWQQQLSDDDSNSLAGLRDA